MTRPDDESPPLDVTSTLHMGSLDDVLEGHVAAGLRGAGATPDRQAVYKTLATTTGSRTSRSGG